MEIEPQNCLYCAKRSTVVTHGEPEVGSPVVCLTCGGLMRVSSDARLMKASIADFVVEIDEGDAFEFMAFYAASRLLTMRRRAELHRNN